jgi:hypothetical protein
MRVAVGAIAVGLALTMSLATAGANDTPGWAVQPTPNPAGAKQSALTGISCSASTACVAVGWSATRAAPYGMYQSSRVVLAERWNGAGWTLQPTPIPAGAKDSEFTAVSCTSANACTAVGTYRDSAGADVTLAERWTGSNWIVQRTVNPGEALTEQEFDAAQSGSNLNGVACASATSCTAVGHYSNNKGSTALIEHWDGSRWTLQTPSDPARHPMSSVSCTASSACTAVGDAQDALAEQWNGAAWVLQRTPSLAPPKTPYGSFTGVSCRSGTVCTAVGVKNEARGDSSVLVPLAEHWDGTGWALQKVPIPPGYTYANNDLVGVSCASNAACTAVGSQNPRSGIDLPLVERWNGSSWTIEQTPSPADILSGGLLSVSCTSPTVCFGVGNFTHKTGGATVTLAERSSA